MRRACQRVALVERDELPKSSANRKGVPQGQHVIGLARKPTADRISAALSARTTSSAIRGARWATSSQNYLVPAAYAVVAWVLLQIVNNLAPGLSLPNWALTFAIVLLAVGFPIALIFERIRELPPADGAVTQAKTGMIDWALMGALVVVIALLSPTTGVRIAQEAAVATATPSALPAQPGGISLAVLPFANLSGDTAQEFFSDGMTEEIMTAPAKVSTPHVVGRESAYPFKGEKKDMRAVGQALSASYLIEGSVRKEGARMRITAQLVQADSGVSLWADSYDREFTSVFATRDDIA